MHDTNDTRGARPERDAAPLEVEVARGHGMSLAQAARRLPPSRGGRPVSPATVTRWAREGVRAADGSRVRLEAVRAGGRWLTTEAAVGRFLRASTEQDDAVLALSAAGSSVTRPQESHLQARAELAWRGV